MTDQNTLTGTTLEQNGESREQPPPSASGVSETTADSHTQSQSASRDLKKEKSKGRIQRRIFKIIVIGDSNVGKTCLTYRFCSGRFPEKTEATIGVDFRERALEVEKEAIKLQLWDTAGQERFRKSMVQHYYRNVHAVVFVYDVTRMSSFQNMPQWIEECNRHSLDINIPRLLVGNKCDIDDKIAVNTNLAQKFADTHNMPLFETSAKDDAKANHVEAIFLTLAHKLKNSKPMMSPHMASYNKDDGDNTITIGSSARGARLQASHSMDNEDKREGCAC